MKPRFITQLDETAQADIRKRLEVLKNTFGDITDESIEEAMSDKINVTIPNIEWQEWLHYSYDLELYVDDNATYQNMLDEFSKYQENRRKKYGYDY